MDNLDIDFYDSFIFPVRGRVLSSDSLVNIYLNDNNLLDKNNFLFASRRGSSKELAGGEARMTPLQGMEEMFMLDKKQQNVRPSKFKMENSNQVSSIQTLPKAPPQQSENNNTEVQKIFTCSFIGCKKTYKARSRLQIHERTHTGLKPFKCSVCEKAFNEKGNLMTHMRIHTGEKPYKCNVQNCNKAFKAYGHLSDHLKRHFDIRPFECDFCKATFSRRNTLKTHLMTHTGEKPFSCSFPGCPKRFSEKGNMKTHLKTHMKKEKMYSQLKADSEYNDNSLSETANPKSTGFFVNRVQEFTFLGRKHGRKNSVRDGKNCEEESKPKGNAKQSNSDSSNNASTGDILTLGENPPTANCHTDNKNAIIPTNEDKSVVCKYNYLQLLEKFNQSRNFNTSQSFQNFANLSNLQNYQNFLLNYKLPDNN